MEAKYQCGDHPTLSLGQSAEGYRKLEVHGCPEGNENGNVTQFGSTQRWMMPGNLASQSQLLALGHPTVDDQPHGG